MVVKSNNLYQGMTYLYDHEYIEQHASAPHSANVKAAGKMPAVQRSNVPRASCLHKYFFATSQLRGENRRSSPPGCIYAALCSLWLIPSRPILLSLRSTTVASKTTSASLSGCQKRNQTPEKQVILKLRHNRRNHGLCPIRICRLSSRIGIHWPNQ